MSNLIILEVPFWAKKSWVNDSNFNGMIAILPIYNRNGIYIQRKNKMVILECEYGCFDLSKDYKSYIYDLNMLNHIPLSDEEYKSLKIILKSSRINSKYKKYLYEVFGNEKQRRYLRNLEIESKKVMISFKNKMKE